MATREVQYANGQKGYEAMVSDFTEMFNWDEVTPFAEDTTKYTDFKKNNGGGTYAALRVSLHDKAPSIRALFNTGSTTLIESGCNYFDNIRAKYVAYAWGNGFFALCASNSAMPNANPGNYTTLAGISTSRNIWSGETGWCSFSNTANSNNRYPFIFRVLSKDETAMHNLYMDANYNAKVGAAMALHNPITGCVSDKVMILTAIPDSNYTCLNSAVFNSTRYIRLGVLLVPTE